MLTRELLAYRFAPDATFEGELVGALERSEIHLLDGVFVARETGMGEFAAVALPGSSSTMVMDLLDFRLDARARSAHTERALAGPAADIVRLVADTLEPGEAMAVLLVEHSGTSALEDAVNRVGGAQTASTVVDATQLSEVAEPLREIASR